ncbi:hypothetical protein [Luteimonas sp. 3794]|uniref:hypothetical protein n=1 Tax=Luteimonas sp. 3794 TaxID=2817730 RepID=UPI00285CA62E|nr:hypothetical protein [Luteimonas sp. 3794]MDR6991561.1 hypothetical protein [Luteimonas sp. 3794]
MTMRCVALLLMWLLISPLAAQEPAHPCARLAGPAARLACYDAAFPLSAEVVETEARQVQAAFGLNGPQAPLRSTDDGADGSASDGFEGRVVKVDYGPGGLRSFRFENGQVWIQTEARGSGHVQDGQIVQLRKGILGSYQLVTPAGVVLRVRRSR